MERKNRLVRGSIAAGAFVLSVVAAAAIAGGPSPVGQCTHTHYCYVNGKLVSSTTAYGGICRINQKCVGDGGCEPEPWATADCVDIN